MRPHAPGDAGCIRRHARRYVACVNACEGISTETLEQRGMAPIISLEQQRDELLAALKKIDQFGFAMGMAECQRLAQAAIARAEAA
ncbi:hypothetical protein [Aromatoleum aromaticum]|uniref:hypothetical protein n=1 Tax=Aromatoleum aromaticum TaxID=551760 RepID=UPI0005A03B73|nr:hypothetical protein [Aromatoleum aromaticum]